MLPPLETPDGISATAVEMDFAMTAVAESCSFSYGSTRGYADRTGGSAAGRVGRIAGISTNRARQGQGEADRGLADSHSC